MGEPDYEQTADRLEQGSEALEHHVRELEDQIEHARSEWDRKRADPAVPGAPLPEESDDAGAAESGEAGRGAAGRPTGDEQPSGQQTPP
jgi:hypothetical protein